MLCIKVLGLNFPPYDYPLGRSYFPDFVRFVDRFRLFHSPAFFARGRFEFFYPAPAATVYEFFFGLFPRDSLFAFLSFIVGALGVAAVLFGRSLLRRGISFPSAILFPLLVVTCSYPVWCVIKQGNIEIAIWILVTAGVASFFAGRGYWAAACFGLAASMKIYPVVFLGLLVSRRQYRQVVLGGCVLAAATIVSLWLVCPAIVFSWQQYRQGLDHFRELYVLLKRPEIGTDHSLFAVVKLLLEPFPGPERMGRILSGYLAVMGLAATGLFFGFVRHLPSVNQVICLAVTSVLLPPVSYEYTLLHMLAPLALLVLLTLPQTEPGRVRGVPSALLCLVVLLAPLPELIWHGRVFEGQVKAVALLMLFGIALRYPFPLAFEKERWAEGQSI